MLRVRDLLTEEEQKRAEVLITERILGHQWYYLSDIILAFVSYGSEISTLEILKETLAKGKKLYLPKIVELSGAEKDPEVMHFYRIRSLADLRTGYHGILEPADTSELYQYDAMKTNNTLLLMPGVGFDDHRNRLGYGKGFYDRFLSDKRELSVRSIAIGHACQRISRIPSDERDIKPYQVILV